MRNKHKYIYNYVIYVYIHRSSLEQNGKRARTESEIERSLESTHQTRMKTGLDDSVKAYQRSWPCYCCWLARVTSVVHHQTLYSVMSNTHTQALNEPYGIVHIPAYLPHWGKTVFYEVRWSSLHKIGTRIVHDHETHNNIVEMLYTIIHIITMNSGNYYTKI